MHDVALRAQVWQGYEEFKVRICRLSFIHASGGLLTTLTYIAYPWVVHVNPWRAGTAGSGTTGGEVLHSVGMEVEY